MKLLRARASGRVPRRRLRGRIRRFLIVGTGAGLTALTLAASQPASASYPGTNGKIAFGSLRDPTYQIYVMNADGTDQTRLASSTSDLGATWSPDGTKIAFRSYGYPEGNPGGIFTMNPDGSGRTQLSWGVDELPSWSPDGTKIAFDRFPQETPSGSSYEIYVVNSDGSGGETQLTFGAADGGHPSWSPDGTKLAFMSLRDGNPEVYVMNADGSNPVRLTTNAADDYYPDWSPDGTKIAFSSNRDGQFEIYVMSPDGSNLTRIAPGLDCTSPSWSPDGTKIVCGKSGYGSEIWVMNADGSNQTRLTTGYFLDNTPDWQPLPLSWTWSGFFRPVDNMPTANPVKAGRSIPVSFSLGGFRGYDIFAAGYPKSGLAATAGSLSYDPATGRYTYVWRTDKAWAGTDRQLIVRLSDGSAEHCASFSFR